MYQIILEGKQIKKNQVTGMHMMAGLLLIVMGFLTWLVPNGVKQEQFAFLNYVGLGYLSFGILIIIICIFFNKKVIQTRGNDVLRVLEFISLGAILIYALVQQWYMPAGYSAAALIGITLALYWEKAGKLTRKATFDDEGIQIPRFGRNSELAWQDISRVILKHNILTIDCNNNKLFQFSVDKENKTIDNQAFEEYCAIQIKSKSHLIKNYL